MRCVMTKKHNRVTKHMLDYRDIFLPCKNIDMGGISMEWVELVMDHSTITIIFLVLCLLLLNFGSVLWIAVIGFAAFALAKIL